MLDEWLATTTLATFRATHWQQQPLAGAASAARAVPLLSWDTIDRVLRSDRELDVLTVAGGRVVDVAPPRSLADARRLMRAGVTTLVRAGERHDLQLAMLADSFARLMPGEVHVQLYATPRGTNSFGWHYDFEDVFVVQTDIPSRWWHLVKCVEDSLSISVGVMGPDTIRSAHHLPRGWGNYGTGRTA